MTSQSPYQDPATARLFAYIARDAHVAVVLRRGPGTKTLMLRWNLDDDTFTEGQWLHSRVYNARCDLSPCGRYFAYFTGRFSGHYYAFTAISPVPYFSAYILWPQDHAWGGGAHFDGARKTVRLNMRTKDPEPASDGKGKKIPRYLRESSRGKSGKKLMNPDFGSLPSPYENVEPLGESAGCGEDGPPEYIRMIREGWVLEERIQRASIPRQPVQAPDDANVRFVWKTEGASVWSKTRDGKTLRLIRDQHGEINGRSIVMRAELGAEGEVRDFQRVDWADFDSNGDVLFARNGRLYRVDVDGPRELIDLNEREIRNVPPPEGMPKRRGIEVGVLEEEEGKWSPLD